MTILFTSVPFSDKVDMLGRAQEPLDLPAVHRNCLSHAIAIDRAKNDLAKLVSSPNTQLVNEYTALVQKEFTLIEQFVYGNKIPHEDIGVLYDALKTKYGIEPTHELSKYVSDKMHIIVEAGRGLNKCPCCSGVKTHTIPESDFAAKEETYDCETCGGTGKLA